MLEGKALVNTSASCDLEAANGVQITPSSIFSLMKCRSISICFVLYVALDYVQYLLLPCCHDTIS